MMKPLYRCAGTLFGTFSSFLYFYYIPDYPASALPWGAIFYGFVSLLQVFPNSYSVVSFGALTGYTFSFFDAVNSAEYSGLDVNTQEGREFCIDFCGGRIFLTTLSCVLVIAYCALVYPNSPSKDFYATMSKLSAAIKGSCIQEAGVWAKLRNDKSEKNEKESLLSSPGPAYGSFIKLFKAAIQQGQAAKGTLDFRQQFPDYLPINFVRGSKRLVYASCSPSSGTCGKHV